MTAPDDFSLIDLLACPKCRSALASPSGEFTAEPAPRLVCSSCGASYEVREGIPILHPPEIDPVHLAEEEKLGALMTDLPEALKHPLSEREWKLSKHEFWGFVRGKLSGGEGKTVVNIGCGVDREFLELGARHTVVAFDLLYPLLKTLRDRHGSRYNVAGAVQALPFRDASFDAVCCIDLLHHEPDRLEGIISSLHRILKPGGMLFLEDVNAWGSFQIWKSIWPRPVHGGFRSIYHRVRRSPHQPAPYEFPTSVFRVRRLLRRAGFTGIAAMQQHACPNTGAAGLTLWHAMARFPRVGRYHNFHYLLFAVKK